VNKDQLVAKLLSVLPFHLEDVDRLRRMYSGMSNQHLRWEIVRRLAIGKPQG
jgi:hypothetical protein